MINWGSEPCSMNASSTKSTSCELRADNYGIISEVLPPLNTMCEKRKLNIYNWKSEEFLENFNVNPRNLSLICFWPIIDS